jgi:hypothetical protein
MVSTNPTPHLWQGLLLETCTEMCSKKSPALWSIGEQLKVNPARSPSIRLGSAESDDFFYREVPQAAAKSQQRWSIGDAFEPLASRLRHSCHPVAPRL